MLAFVVGVFWLQFLLNSGGIDDDGGFSINRAFVFADATARTLFLFHNGALLLVTHNCLVGKLFITDEADLLRVIGNASVLIDMSHPDLNEAFLFNGERPNRFGGANPSAKIAEFFAISDTGNQPRRIETC